MADGSGGDFKLLGMLLAAGLVLVLILGLVGGPLISEVSAVLQPGMGIREAVLWGFGVTVGLFLLFAMVAGDGFIGEFQFMLGAFFFFFIVLTLLIAWVF